MTHHILQIHQETYFEILYVFEIKINEMRQKLKIVMTKSDILNTFYNPFDFQFDSNDNRMLLTWVNDTAIQYRSR